MTSRRGLTKVEKLMIISVVLMIISLPLLTIFTKGQLSAVNIRVERLRRQISTQNKVNESLTMKVNQLVSLDNLQSVALEKGLVYNSNNIVTIKK
ncbi:MAG TPA: hypothetical protein PKY25_02890 [Bacilli bacterium]|nr:hypothetical protein [Bacilli bacterium]